MTGYSPAGILPQEREQDLVSLNDDLIQENIMLKQRNKILVSVNRVLRDRCSSLQEELDTLVADLYEADLKNEASFLESLVA